MDWTHEKWADHLQGLRQSWQDDRDNMEADPNHAFGARRLLISQWVDFLFRWTPSTGRMDETFQEMIDEVIPEAACAVGLDPLDFWFKVTALWNWRRMCKQEYEDGYLMVEGFQGLAISGEEAASRPRKGTRNRRKSAGGR